MAAQNPPTLHGRIRSLRCALRGIRILLATQINARIHAAATVLVVAAGLIVGLSASDWAWIVLAMAAVWTAEAFNTALEFLTDLVSPGLHPLAGKAKDAAAGAVLLCVIGAVVIGGLVYLPRCVALFD